MTMPGAGERLPYVILLAALQLFALGSKICCCGAFKAFRGSEEYYENSGSGILEFACSPRLLALRVLALALAASNSTVVGRPDWGLKFVLCLGPPPHTSLK